MFVEAGSAAGAARRGRGAAASPAPSSSTVTTSERPSLRAPTRTRPPAISRLEAVDDRVLDQRLQRQRRQGESAQRRRHLDRVVEPVLHPDLDDLHVGVDQVDLVAERVAAVSEPESEARR